MVKEADDDTRLKLIELQLEELDERVIGHDAKWKAAKPVLKNASNNNITVGIAILITVLNLLLLLLR